ncbi:hypothetical protein M408DRAFT_15659 [Serendipita vermifera MAFF 305830]|uniref:NudC domain-containing protein 1 n=1 Tax=Serendipita vermifera MAFF 305830 TaxID=933852 RepID=A0A0C3BEW5_SERVB|nr:hypothetical protein M408DRAFT_15659 [Serendipita vermifera MAFF 305830]
MAFNVKRSLLNSKFDGYKLSPLTDADCVNTTPLPAQGLSQSTVSAKSHLYFQEVQSRVRHNHLAVAGDSEAIATFAYIGKEREFTSILIDKVSLQVQIHPLFELPATVQTAPDTSSLDSEYPVSVSLGNNRWILSDGTGRFYLLETATPATSARQLANYEVASNNELLPCRLHAAVEYEGTILMLISSRGAAPKGKKEAPTFDLAAVRIALILTPSEIGETYQAETLWRKHGTDIPSYVDFRAGNWFVCAGSTFEDHVQTNKPPTKVQADVIGGEIQPTGQLPPPYSWTQTSDSLTVAFPLPSSTPKSHISVRIGPKHVSILIKESETSDFPIPRYAMKELWDTVDQSTSTWTWDKEGERTVGLLTLHLEKRNEGTKWSHVFAREGTGPEEVEVPETIDPSELWKIRETLEKYTSDIKASNDEAGFGNEMPSLATGEMDPTVDSEVGRKQTVSYFDALTGEDLAPNTAYQEILAFPLPGLSSPDGQASRSLTVKNGIDGPVFDGPIVPSVDVWEHVSTFPALAFVLASKRDTRFAFHIGRRAVVALESGGRVAGPNMYIYHDAKGKSQAKQGVLRLGGDGQSGSLLGVGGFEQDGKVVLVCLRERELVLVHDFL